MTNSKPYKTGTPLDEIIRDGWSRGFKFEQTIEEAKIMGFIITEEDLLKEWDRLEYEMIEYFDSIE